MQDPKEIAKELVENFPGDEYWIDKPAAIASIAAALQAERERTKEECARVADDYAKKAGTAFFVCDFIADAIRALP